MTSLLSRPPQVAARLIALDLLRRAGRAAVRLDDPDDSEALHDFRTSLRRLRSISRAYRAPLAGSLRKRDRRRLRDISRATGPGREAEVAVAWIEGQRQALAGDPGTEERPGLDWLRQRFERRRGRGYAEVRQRTREEFLPFASELEGRLGVYNREIHLVGDAAVQRFGELVGSEAAREMARLRHLLGQVGDASDAEAVHQSRLSVKRLRYLLEPLRDDLEAVRPILKRLSDLQDLMGDLHDAYALEDELIAAVEAAALEVARGRLEAAMAEGGDEGGDGVKEIANGAGTADAAAGTQATEASDPLPGLLALVGRNRQRRDRLFGELATGWLPVAGEGAPPAPARTPGLTALSAAVGDLVHWLEAGFSPPPPASAGAAPTLVS